MIGKKQYKDVQFFTEVGEISTDLSKRTNAYDRDELELEQQEKKLRRRLASAFSKFFKAVEELTSENSRSDPRIPQLEFDIPFRELGKNKRTRMERRCLASGGDRK